MTVCSVVTGPESCCWPVQMDLTCFIALTIFLQSANATFAAFSQGQSKISLDYNQWIYAAANVV